MEADELLLLSLSLHDAMELFSASYKDYMGVDQLNFNVHLFTHAPLVHEHHGPLNNVSAFPSENMYQTLLSSYVTGTATISKQAMQNVMLKLAMAKDHKCSHSLKVSSKPSLRTHDHIVMDEDKRLNLVLEVGQDCQRLRVSPVKVKEFNYTMVNGCSIPFRDIGVFKVDQNDLIQPDNWRWIERKSIVGKGVLNFDYIVSARKNVLLENSY